MCVCVCAECACVVCSFGECACVYVCVLSVRVWCVRMV